MIVPDEDSVVSHGNDRTWWRLCRKSRQWSYLMKAAIKSRQWSYLMKAAIKSQQWSYLMKAAIKSRQWSYLMKADIKSRKWSYLMKAAIKSQQWSYLMKADIKSRQWSYLMKAAIKSRHWSYLMKSYICRGKVNFLCTFYGSFKAIFGLEIYTSFIKTFRLKWNYHLKVNTWNTIVKYIKHLLLQTNTALQIDYHNNDNICQWINEEKHNITDNKGFCSWNEMKADIKSRQWSYLMKADIKSRQWSYLMKADI
jgi:hypothetical protein